MTDTKDDTGDDFASVLEFGIDAHDDIPEAKTLAAEDTAISKPPKPLAPAPELTGEDVHAFIQVLTALCMMGSTRIEVHPERWPLIFRGLIMHRAYNIEDVYYADGVEDFDHAVLHIEFQAKKGPVGCLLTMRGVHPGESDEQQKLLDDQGPHYDVPEEPKLVEGAKQKIWMPGSN